MRKPPCPREAELVDTLQTSPPSALDDSLREHAAGCASCGDTLAVVSALLGEHHTLMHEAAVPSSAIVWWRAQMRSRREAAATASRPISFVQGVALACAAGLLATLLGIFVPAFRQATVWIANAANGWSALSLPIGTGEFVANPLVLAGVAAVALCALVLPVALYFAFHED